MKHIRKALIGCLVLVLVCAYLPALPARAEGTTLIAVSKSSMNVGDKLTVTIKTSESATVNLKYNSGILKLTGCSAQGYAAQGNTVTYTGQTVDVTFEAVSAGSSYLSAKPQNQGISGASTTVQVAAPASGGQPAEDPAPNTGTGGQNASQPKGQFEIDGTSYVVSERYTSQEIPAGFSKVELTIQGSSYTELSNGKLTLIYLKPASNTSGRGAFHLYHEQEQSVTPMVLVGSMEDYVILLTPAEVPGKLTQASFALGERQISGYEIAENADGFYYLYGMDESGSEQWFEYDTKDGSMQRANTALLEQDQTQLTEKVQSTTSATDGKKNISTLRLVIAVLIFVLVVLAIVVVNLLLGRRRRQEEFDFGDEDLVEDDEEPEAAAQLEEEILIDAKAEAGENEEDFYENDTPRIRAMFSEGEKTSVNAEKMVEETDVIDAAEDDEVAARLEPELDQLNLAEETKTPEQETKEKKKKDLSEKEIDLNDLEILDLNDL